MRERKNHFCLSGKKNNTSGCPFELIETFCNIKSPAGCLITANAYMSVQALVPAFYANFFEMPPPEAIILNEEGLYEEIPGLLRGWILSVCIRGVQERFCDRATEAVLSDSPVRSCAIGDAEAIRGIPRLFLEMFCAFLRRVERDLEDSPGTSVCITHCTYEGDSLTYYIFWKIGSSVTPDE